jgi:P27 family predicted phage terminase small subunit
VKGNPGKRAINKREPQPLGDLGEPPDGLSEAQRAIWIEAISDAPKGLLKRIDASVFLAWVVARELHARAMHAQSKLDASSPLQLLMRTRNGEIVQSPYLPIINKQAAIMTKCAAELGFTPSTRSRISIQTPEEDDDATAKYFAGA